MDIGNRLVFFLCILITCYSTQTFKQKTVPAEGPSPVARTFYTAFWNFLAYCVSGLIFSLFVSELGLPGTESVMELVFAGGIALVVSGLTLFAPKNQVFLTMSLNKMMVSVVFLLSIATFSKIEADDLAGFMYHVIIYGIMYFVFSVAYIGAIDRMAIADIPKSMKGLPIGIVTLFLMYISFSFFNGVFFGSLF